LEQVYGKFTHDEVENMKKGEASRKALAMPRLRATAQILKERMLCLSECELAHATEAGRDKLTEMDHGWMATMGPSARAP
jgi:hypothetical protein